MTHFTPGPWIADPKTGDSSIAIREKGGAGYLIATVWADDTEKEDADANLIATAPELLELARLARDLLGVQILECRELKDTDGEAASKQAFEKAQAIIAKAEGK